MKKIKMLVCAGLATMAFAAQATTYIGTITSTALLYSGDFLQSANGAYTLAMQPDGNLVIYQIASNGTLTAKWATNPAGSGAYAAIQSDGNLVVYRANNTAFWDSRTARAAGSYKLMMSDNGALAIIDPNGTTVIWSANAPVSTAGVCGPNTATLPFISYSACSMFGTIKTPSTVLARCPAEASILAASTGRTLGFCIN